jgi:SAM-dependent methyltransferase
MRLVARVLLGLLGLLVSILLGRRLAQRWQRVRLGRPAVPLAAALLAPERLLPRLPLEPGMRVLIVGPASPWLVQAVARAVGKYGRVYTLEPTGQRAQRLTAALRAGRATNIEVLVGRPARLDLPDSTFDLVLCVGVLADLPQRERALWEMHRVLRPGGHLSVSEALVGPSYLRRATLQREADAVGFTWREQRGSPLAYTANFRKAA